MSARFSSVLLNIVASDDFTKFGELIGQGSVDLAEVDDSGRTILHWAAQEGAVEIAEMVVSAVPELMDSEDYEGHTSLRVAAGEGQLLVVLMLLRKGASLTSGADAKGGTVYELAKKFGHSDVETALNIAKTNPHVFRS